MRSTTTHGRTESTPTHRPTTVVTTVVIVSLVIVSGFGGSVAAAEDPETAEEYFETFRALEGTDSLEEYDEFETMRTFAVTQVQEAGTLDADDRAALDATHETMLEFDQAYEHAENGEYVDALAAAEETERAIAELETHDDAQAALARVALTRFYASIGDELQGLAEDADRTPDELELLEMTATAYERAGLVDEAAEFRLRAEQRAAEYDRDVERMDAAESGSTAFLDECDECTEITGVVGGRALETFDAYDEARIVYEEVRVAEERAAVHGLDDRAEEFATTAEDVGERRDALALASVSVLLGYGVVVGLLGTIVLSRVFVWRRTYDAAQVGSIVQIGDSDV